MNRTTVLVGVVLALLATLAIGALGGKTPSSAPLDELRARYAKDHVPSVDHAKLPALQVAFDSPQEVTETCLSCHTERGQEVLASSHWNWEREEYVPGHGIRFLGKKNVLNNFCIGVSSNLQACDKCHAGYGFVDQAFDFNQARNIDCLVCHDNSGTYVKTGSGMPADDVDLTLVSQNVGLPKRDNCGACHFLGGGGNNVKHGDLELALLDATRDVDVHMGIDGADLECSACHITENHQMHGKLYSVSSMNRNRSSCEQCHGDTPHENGIINEHTLKVACQTCHIPTYAKASPTKLAWDWSTAGELRDGQPFEEKDADGNLVYMSKKGSFRWGRNVVPEYVWFNGTAEHYLLGDTDPADDPIRINALGGSYDDPKAKIIPVKIHRGKQLFDPVNQMLIQPKLVGTEHGQGAYWKDFDWDAAARAGMAEVGLPYSGQHTFVETEMTWPINHMVAPKEQSLSCTACHTRDNSRMAGLAGFYMPGRDRSDWVDRLGKLAILAVGAGVLLHGGTRVFLHWRAGHATPQVGGLTTEGSPS